MIIPRVLKTVKYLWIKGGKDIDVLTRKED